MARRVFGPDELGTPSLTARTARLHAELAAVIERSCDLCWWAQEVRAGSNPYGRAIRGGASVDDAALLVTMITGVSLCPACISHKSGIPVPRVDGLLKNVA